MMFERIKGMQIQSMEDLIQALDNAGIEHTHIAARYDEYVESVREKEAALQAGDLQKLDVISDKVWRLKDILLGMISVLYDIGVITLDEYLVCLVYCMKLV